MGFVRTLPDGRAEYTANGWTVLVAPNGAITVQPGDWLSKYAVAIYGNYQHVGRNFGRKDGQGHVRSFDEIPGANINVIHVGETIYHMPRYRLRPGDGAPDAKPLTEAEARQLIEETLRRDYGLTGSQLQKAADLVSYLGWGARGGSMGAVGAEIVIFYATEVGVLSSVGGAFFTGIVGAVGTAAGVAGALLVPVIAVIGLVRARSIHVTNTALRAVGYATVAWSFEDPKPMSLPERIRRNVLDSVQIDPVKELERVETAWRQAVGSVYASLDQEARRKKVAAETLKGVYRYAGNKNRKEMGTALMIELANQKFSRKLEKNQFLYSEGVDEYYVLPNVNPKHGTR